MLGQTTLHRSLQLHIRDGSSDVKTITVVGPRFLIGREPNCDLRPRDLLVSRRHAEIFWEGDQIFLRDLNSRNGTLLNDDRVLFPTPLQNGDVITVGRHLLNVRMDDSSREGPAHSDAEIASWLDHDLGAAARPPQRPYARPGETHVKDSKRHLLN
jgi:pSer/pThr/pTyr-binding forkhead associated (FHA) protein